MLLADLAARLEAAEMPKPVAVNAAAAMEAIDAFYRPDPVLLEEFRRQERRYGRAKTAKDARLMFERALGAARWRREKEARRRAD